MKAHKNAKAELEHQSNSLINDSLTKKSEGNTLFPEKLAKAVRIMTLVREKQENTK